MITLGWWGKALAARLPSHIVKAAGLRAGMTCSMRLLDSGEVRMRFLGSTAAEGAKANVEAAAEEPADPTNSRRPAKW